MALNKILGNKSWPSHVSTFINFKKMLKSIGNKNINFNKIAFSIYDKLWVKISKIIRKFSNQQLQMLRKMSKSPQKTLNLT